MGKRSRRAERAAGGTTIVVRAADAMQINDPAFLEFMRTGQGGAVSVRAALEHPAVLRCVDLIAGSIGMLPLRLMRRDADGAMVPAEEHSLHRVLAYRPNGWQSPSEFKRLMQTWALAEGNAYALVVRSLGRVVELRPVPPERVSVEQTPDWSLDYRVTGPDGQPRAVPTTDILHLRGPGLDGVRGLSRVRLAAMTLSTAQRAREAAEHLYRHGIMASGALRHPGRLGTEAVEHLRRSMEDRYAGSANAGKWMILEEGMEAQTFPATAESSQLVEMRAAQVEEIARIFGVPRPLMGMDETSWGSGIEQLAILFSRFTLGPWMVAWEEAIRRTLLPEREWAHLVPDFDERELLRGTLKDQAEFFARALGSGGGKPWMEPNEVRELSGLGSHAEGAGLAPVGRMDSSQAGTRGAGAAIGEETDVTETAARAARA